MMCSARAIALGAAVAVGIAVAAPASAAEQPSVGEVATKKVAAKKRIAKFAAPAAPAEEIDERTEFYRVATGYYEPKRERIPMPVPRPGPDIRHMDDPAEHLAVATGAFDPPRAERPAAKGKAAKAKIAVAAPLAAVPESPPAADRPLDGAAEFYAVATGQYDVPKERTAEPAAAKTAEAVASAPEPAPARGIDLSNPYKDLVERYAAQHGLPVALADAVVRIESSYNPQAQNAGAIGLMQIMLPTARGLGYAGDAQGLHNPETNVKYGMMYLAQAYRMSNGDTCQTVMRYQSGHYTAKPNAANVAYCEKARTLMARAG